MTAGNVSSCDIVGGHRPPLRFAAIELSKYWRLRHMFVTTFERLYFGGGYFFDDSRLCLFENLARDTAPFQVRLVHPDRIPFAPVLELFGRKDLSGFLFIMGGMASHSKSLGEYDNRPTSAAHKI